jgi:hypothetical protein
LKGSHIAFVKRWNAIRSHRFHDDVVIIDKEELFRYSGILTYPENLSNDVSVGIGGWKFVGVLNVNESFQPGRPFANDEYLAEIGQVLENGPE